MKVYTCAAKGRTTLKFPRIYTKSLLLGSMLRQQIEMVMCGWKMRYIPEVSKWLCTCAVLLMVQHMVIHTAVAQQDYNNASGYACQSGEAAACDGYVMYRSGSSKETVKSVARLFNISARAVAKVSARNLTTSNNLEWGEALYIPLRCKCSNGTYQALVKYTILSGDTFRVVANFTFHGLSTWQAIQAANPTTVPTQLAIGQKIDVPLRCACPSSPQLKIGTQYLLSYSIFPTETLSAISSYFGVSIPDLISANHLSGVTQVLEAFSTLLIPLSKLTPLNSITFIVPQPTPSITPSLAQGNGPSSSPAVTTAEKIYKNRSNTPLYVGVAVGAFGMILAAIFAALLTTTKACRRHQEQGSESRRILKLHPSVTSSRSDLLDGVSSIADSEKPVIFTYEELRAATNDFSPDHRLQGSVFWGKLNGEMVAIKKMKGNMAHEIKILSQIHHQNVVRLIGVCVRDFEHLFLVFEYADNGSLSDCLHSQVTHPSSTFSITAGLLPWTTRIQIALDIASGLEYIHNYTNPSFVHKDVKSSNILLDAHWHAKVANFGMAKSASAVFPSGPMLTNNIVGTQGYMAPEYLEHGLVTTKADVFSFGVVLLELLTGEEAILRKKDVVFTQGSYQTTLTSAVAAIFKEKELEHNQKRELQSWMDLRLHEAYPHDAAFDVALLANACVATDLSLRPSMTEITFALSNVLAATMEWEASTVRKHHMMPGMDSAAR